MMTFAEKLKQARISKGLSQAELARRVGISRAAISRYESGERTRISTPIAISISKVLDVGFDLVAGYTIVGNEVLIGKKDDVIEINQASESRYERKMALKKIKQYFDKMNDHAIWEAVKRIEEMTFVPEYKKDGGENGQG